MHLIISVYFNNREVKIQGNFWVKFPEFEPKERRFPTTMAKVLLHHATSLITQPVLAHNNGAFWFEK